MSTVPITQTGRTEVAARVATGLYFINIDGTFGGTSIQVDWAPSCDGPWSPLLDESGSPTAITGVFNKQVTLGLGVVSFVATGGTGIDVKATLSRA